MRIAIYARVSKSDGTQTTDHQVRELRAWAERLMLTGEPADPATPAPAPAEYLDEESGARADRPELTRLLRDAHARKFDLLLCWSLDRLTREGPAAALDYLERLKRAGVRAKFLQDPALELDGPAGEIVLCVMSVLARAERERLRERTRTALANLRAGGTRLGRPPRITPDLEDQVLETVRECGVSGAARLLKLPKTTVARFVRQRRRADASPDAAPAETA